MTKSPDLPPRPAYARLPGQLASGAFAVCTGIWLSALLAVPSLAQPPWFQAIFLVTALAATLFALGRALPAQNVLMTAAIIALLSGFAVMLGVKIGLPFGLISYSDNFGPQIFGLLPWPVPVIWVLAILNSRGVARLILRPWRKLGKYGYWSFALTVALAVAFDFNLEPFATKVNQWWLWREPDTVLAWYSAPWSNFLGWTVVSVVILAFATPWLINKRPARHSPPDYQPLALWLALNLTPALGCAMQHLWWAAGFSLVASSFAAYFAVKGGRW